MSTLSSPNTCHLKVPTSTTISNIALVQGWPHLLCCGQKNCPYKLGGHQKVSKIAWRAKFNLLKTHNHSYFDIKHTSKHYNLFKTLLNGIAAFVVLYFSIRCCRILDINQQILFSKKLKGQLKMSWQALFCPRAVVWRPLV